jgi:hypothetical protein
LSIISLLSGIARAGQARGFATRFSGKGLAAAMPDGDPAQNQTLKSNVADLPRGLAAIFDSFSANFAGLH